MTIGYDNIPMLFQTVLDIPMYEGVGMLAHDIARPPATALDKTMTLTGAPTWAQWPLSNLTVLNFDETNPDFMELAVAESTDMDYQAGAFSLAAWVYAFDLGMDRYIIERGLLDTDGWYFYVLTTGNLIIRTNQAAAGQTTNTAAGVLAATEWALVGVTRLGASCRIYKNGVDVTDTAGAHIDPLTSARKLHVGIDDTEAANQWNGYIWRPRIWSRQLSDDDFWKLFEMERGLFGV